MKKIMLLLLPLLLFSCGKEDRMEGTVKTPEVLLMRVDTNDAIQNLEVDSPEDEYWTKYLIPQGANYNTVVNFAPLQHDTIIVNIRFDSSAVYQTIAPQNQLDWNKLIGFSDCGSFHQQNSVRLVWRWNVQDNLIDLGEYIYKNGKVSYQKIEEVQINESFRCIIFTNPSSYNIVVKGSVYSSPRPCNSNAGRYWLLPYFGGNEISPRDITVHIKHIFPRKVI